MVRERYKCSFLSENRSTEYSTVLLLAKYCRVYRQPRIERSLTLWVRWDLSGHVQRVNKTQIEVSTTHAHHVAEPHQPAPHDITVCNVYVRPARNEPKRFYRV